MTQPLVSPSLLASRESPAAYELKFLVDEATAQRVEQWARTTLTPDPHGVDGVYRTTTLYLDTPALDVFHRSPGYRRSKYRLRRYGETPAVQLERKTKRGDRVRKRRTGIALDELPLVAGAEPEPDWAWSWFLRQVRFRGLRPVCRIGYERTAFFAHNVDGPVRLTLDRRLIGEPAQQQQQEWSLAPLTEGRALLPAGVVLELKYQAVLPLLFRDLLVTLPPDLGRVSKYRLCISTWGLAARGNASTAQNGVPPDTLTGLAEHRNNGVPPDVKGLLYPQHHHERNGATEGSH